MTEKKIRTHLVAGGQYHDIDYARQQLLAHLLELENVRTTVSQDYRIAHLLPETDFLVTYTCNVCPSAEEVKALEAFLNRGGKWLALHGTNSILAQNEKGRWFAPEDKTGFMTMLGSQFAAHPPIAPYRVHAQNADDPLVAGIGDFDVEGGDELYYMRLFGDMEIILDAAAQGPAKGFEEREWPEDQRHPVLYRKNVGEGEIVYFTLGHRRGHYDMAPLMDYFPNIEKGAWEIDAYRQILKRGLAWGAGKLNS